MQFKTHTEYLKEIAEALRQYRLRMNITQAELAKRIGVNVNTIRKLESSGEGTMISFLKVLNHFNKAQELVTLFPMEPVIDLYKSSENKQRRRASRKS